MDAAARRAEMVRTQIERRGVRDPRVLEAMRRVPRERFLPAERAAEAFDDAALPFAHGQTISQPYIVALMTEALRLPPGGRVLEIGTGSGYAAAVLAEVVGEAGQVFSVERIPDLARDAAATLESLGYARVRVREGDGTNGLPAFAPFDGISVTAAAPDVPPPLIEQLCDGARLVVPVGDRLVQRLVLVERRGRRIDQRTLEDVRFVPLIGAHGWAA